MKIIRVIRIDSLLLRNNIWIYFLFIRIYDFGLMFSLSIIPLNIFVFIQKDKNLYHICFVVGAIEKDNNSLFFE